jgi:hypothetical protein
LYARADATPNAIWGHPDCTDGKQIVRVLSWHRTRLAAYEAVAKQLADVLENAPQETGGHQISQSFVDDREKALADFDALENQ